MAEERDYWFAPKRHGYGAGPPIRWQGWALLGGLPLPALAASLARALLSPPWHVPRLAVVVATLAYAVVMIPIAQRHTRGGWRWRWGGRD